MLMDSDADESIGTPVPDGRGKVPIDPITLPPDTFCAWVSSCLDKDLEEHVEGAEYCAEVIGRSVACNLCSLIFVGIQMLLVAICLNAGTDNLPGGFTRPHCTAFEAVMNVSNISQGDRESFRAYAPIGGTGVWLLGAEPIFKDYNEAQRAPESEYDDDRIVTSVSNVPGSTPTFVTSVNGINDPGRMAEMLNGLREPALGNSNQTSLGSSTTTVNCSKCLVRKPEFFASQVFFVFLLMLSAVKKNSTAVCLVPAWVELKERNYERLATIVYVSSIAWYIIVPAEILLVSIFVFTSAATYVDLIKDAFAFMVLSEISAMAQIIYAENSRRFELVATFPKYHVAIKLFRMLMAYLYLLVLAWAGLAFWFNPLGVGGYNLLTFAAQFRFGVLVLLPAVAVVLAQCCMCGLSSDSEHDELDDTSQGSFGD